MYPRPPSSEPALRSAEGVAIGNSLVNIPDKEFLNLRGQLMNLGMSLTKMVNMRNLQGVELKREILKKKQRVEVDVKREKELLKNKMKLEIQMEKEAKKQIGNLLKTMKNLDTHMYKIGKSIEMAKKKHGIYEKQGNKELTDLSSKAQVLSSKRMHMENQLAQLEAQREQKEMCRKRKEQQLENLQNHGNNNIVNSNRLSEVCLPPPVFPPAPCKQTKPQLYPPPYHIPYMPNLSSGDLCTNLPPPLPLNCSNNKPVYHTTNYTDNNRAYGDKRTSHRNTLPNNTTYDTNSKITHPSNLHHNNTNYNTHITKSCLKQSSQPSKLSDSYEGCGNYQKEARNVRIKCNADHPYFSPSESHTYSKNNGHFHHNGHGERSSVDCKGCHYDTFMDENNTNRCEIDNNHKLKKYIPAKEPSKIKDLKDVQDCNNTLDFKWPKETKLKFPEEDRGDNEDNGVRGYSTPKNYNCMKECSRDEEQRARQLSNCPTACEAEFQKLLEECRTKDEVTHHNVNPNSSNGLSYDWASSASNLQRNNSRYNDLNDRYGSYDGEMATEGLNKNSNSYIENFDLKQVLTRGCFGELALVVSNITKNEYIVKSICKKECLDSKLCRIKTVFTILAENKHPFYANMHDFMQNEKQLFFVMEFLPGGSLKDHVMRCTTLDDTETVFYASCILLAIKHLHSLDVAHRDISLENVVLDCCGYAKLVGFDFAIPYITHETPLFDKSGKSLYKAPEFFKPCEFTTRSCDFWSLGVVIHAMLTAKCVFTKPCLRLEQNELSASAEDLLVQLLHLVPSERLGWGTSGCHDVMNHHFFKTIDWVALFKKQIVPPLRFINICKKLDKDSEENAAETQNGTFEQDNPPPNFDAADNILSYRPEEEWKNSLNLE